MEGRQSKTDKDTSTGSDSETGREVIISISFNISGSETVAGLPALTLILSSALMLSLSSSPVSQSCLPLSHRLVAYEDQRY